MTLLAQGENSRQTFQNVINTPSKTNELIKYYIKEFSARLLDKNNKQVPYYLQTTHITRNTALKSRNATLEMNAIFTQKNNNKPMEVVLHSEPSPSLNSYSTHGTNSQSKGQLPRMINSRVGKGGSFINAFRRLRNLNNALEDGEELPALPAPGAVDPYPMQIKTVKPTALKKSSNYRRLKINCLCGSMLALLIILIQLFYIMYALIAKLEEQLLMFTIIACICAICIIIMEWARQWLWREASPMIMPNLYNSTVRQTSANLIITASSLQPPVPSESNSLFTSTCPGGGGLSRPELEISSPYSQSSATAVEQGGGFRGSVAPRRLYDRKQVVSLFFLLILYLFSIVWLILGIVWIPSHKSDQDVSMLLMYLIVHSIILLLRVTFCCSSNFCQGLTHGFSENSNNLVTTLVPIVSNNTLHRYLPSLSMNPVSRNDNTGSLLAGVNCQQGSWINNLSSSNTGGNLSLVPPLSAKYADSIHVGA